MMKHRADAQYTLAVPESLGAGGHRTTGSSHGTQGAASLTEDTEHAESLNEMVGRKAVRFALGNRGPSEKKYKSRKIGY